MGNPIPEQNQTIACRNCCWSGIVDVTFAEPGFLWMSGFGRVAKPAIASTSDISANHDAVTDKWQRFREPVSFANRQSEVLARSNVFSDLLFERDSLANALRTARAEALEAAAAVVEPSHRDDDVFYSGWVRWGRVNAVLRDRQAAIRALASDPPGGG